MTDQSSLVPIWPRFVAPVLQGLAVGDTASRREVRRRAIDVLGLSEEARAEVLDSGMARAAHRADWAITHLARAGLIEKVARAQYRIAAEGRTWLAQHPGGLTDFASANRLFGEFWPKGETSPSITVDSHETPSPVVDPLEQIESGVLRIRTEVSDSLLERLRLSDPAFFEDAVVEVLLAMGYGGSEKRGKRIGGTGDGGVDGVIDQDALGLDQVYVQAKRYAPGNNVGRETIQAFVGALHGFGASRGVFITSSDFTSGARDYAKGVPTRISLINGQRLTELMIEYRVGVQVKQTYEIVEIDEDFFE
jgi:restriction system protein